jgi:glucan phosphorylase
MAPPKYKRQHLISRTSSLNVRVSNAMRGLISPHTRFISETRQRPAHYIAKLIIKLINAIVTSVCNDLEMRDRLKVRIDFSQP